MSTITLRDLVERVGCRVGEHAGRDAGCKFWRPFEPVRIKCNMIGYGEISNTFSLQIRHFQDGDMQAIVKFSDWMNGHSREWSLPQILNCASAEEVASFLRKGVSAGTDDQGEEFFWTTLDNDGWDALLAEFVDLGFDESRG